MIASHTSAPLTDGTLTALQDALAAEHAAVYGYGIVGARLSEDRREAARSAFTAHRARRDRLEVLVGERGGTPVRAAPAYAVPFPVLDAADALRLALTIEERVASTYADVVAATTGNLRTLAATALQEAAVRAASWRGSSVPFPGLPERS